MPRIQTTLSQIASALELSVSTISKSLADSAEISELTKNRVREFADKCNYSPNNLARNFRTGETKMIGLIIPNVLNQVYAQILIGSEKYLDGMEYRLVTTLSYESKIKEISSISKLASGYVDGIIICVSEETEKEKDYQHIHKLKEGGFPLVVIDLKNMLMQDNTGKFIVNDYSAEQMGNKAGKLILKRINP
jgi:LacI family transcriptional regulator